MNAVKIKLTMYMYHDMLFINKFVCPIYSTSETRELCNTVIKKLYYNQLKNTIIIK
jgi:hypothetical protein